MTANTNERVGIVGAGITGAATAYYLAEEQPDAEIEVFERHGEVGGRLQTLSVGDRHFEGGGKFLHTDDDLCVEFVEAFGLERADPADVDGSDPPEMGREKTIGIWNGDSFLVNLEGSMLQSVGHLLGSYPLSLYRLYQESSAVDERLDDLNDRIRGGEGFRTTEALAEETGIAEWSREPARQQLTAAGVAEDCIDEVVAATAGTTFGQDPSIHTFGALHSVLSLGASGADPFAIKGGNARLVEALLDASDATVHTDTAVAAIEESDDGYAIQTDDGETGVDTAVLATPYENTDLSLPEAGTPPERPFSTTHLTFVVGDIDAGYFGTDAIPDFVTVADDPEVPFTLLSTNGPVEGRDGVLYELDTPEEPDEELLEALFEEYEVVVSKSWNGFPELDPDVARPPFVLAEDLYYPNAIESLGSTIEFGALAARNTANLYAQSG